jgi:hypothetical protein
MNPLLCAAAMLAPLLIPLPASAEPVSLVHKTPPGQELAIEESSRLAVDVEVVFPDGAGGRSKAKGEHLEYKVRSYTQLIVEAPPDDPRVLELLFGAATKETMKPNGKERVKINTTLHKKRVKVAIDGNTIVRVEPSAGTVSGEDQGDLLFAEKLYSAMPQGEVTPGKVWPIDPDAAGRAIFGAGYDPSLHAVEGKCQFKGTATAGGRRCAKVLVQLKARGQFGGGASSIELAPEGTLHFALEEGFILSYDLTGPVRVTSADEAAGVAFNGQGTFTLRYKATLADDGGK